MKILIAEDDAIAAKVLRLTLQQFKYETVVARDGLEAWELFDREPFRVVISDWMMPQIDGLEFCRRVRSRKQTLYTYFIMVTAAHSSNDDFTLAMEAGVDDFLTKPLDRRIIRTRLRVAERILRYTTALRELEDLIPICAYCHKVRNDSDYWQRVESYITEHTGSGFTHGICPECYAGQIKLIDEAFSAPGNS
jgi:phosphoserine phosphatase RsbU/P